MSDMDWKAAMSSEIFREYLKNELTKEANTPPPPTVNEEQVLDEFDALQVKVRNDPYLRAAFQKLQHKFATDPIYRNKTSPKFVEGVMLLDLDSEE